MKLLPYPHHRIAAARRPSLSLLAVLAAARFVVGDVHGQIEFAVSDLPAKMGDSLRAYMLTGPVAAGELVGRAGGPHRWNFGGPGSTAEVVRRMDIVPPDDAARGAGFPGATYAERWQVEPDGPSSWSYYHLELEDGRNYFGFVDSAANPQNPEIIFEPPTVDLPSVVRFGQSWIRTTEWDDFVVAVPIRVRFTAEATVDAFGTVVLPNLGERPALRINEVQTLESRVVTIPMTLPPSILRTYYWLVPGIGKAVQVISTVQTEVPPSNFTEAARVIRVFEARFASGPFTLNLRTVGDGLILEWPSVSGAEGYRIESRTAMGSGGWRLAAEPEVNRWSTAIAGVGPNVFFRVVSRP